jgi:hypothetical protein
MQPDVYLPEYDLFLELTYAGFCPHTQRLTRPAALEKKRGKIYGVSQYYHRKVILLDGETMAAIFRHRRGPRLLRQIIRGERVPVCERRLAA